MRFSGIKNVNFSQPARVHVSVTTEECVLDLCKLLPTRLSVVVSLRRKHGKSMNFTQPLTRTREGLTERLRALRKALNEHWYWR